MKDIQEYVSPLQILGTSISLMIALVLWFTGNDSLASISIGLLGAILTQLLEIQISYKRAEQNFGKTISLSEKRLLTGLGISHKLFRDTWIAEQLDAIITDYTYIGDRRMPVFFDICRQNAITECRAAIRDLTNGHVYIKHSSPLYQDLEQIIFAQAKKTIYSVAVIDMKYWRNNFGKDFLSKNAKAKENGAEVVRIFVYPQEKVCDIQDILTSQKQQGFTVLFAPREAVTADLQYDYHIVDNEVLTSLQTATGTETVLSVFVSIDPAEITQWNTKFAITRHHAQVVDDEFLDNLRDDKKTKDIQIA